MQIIFHYYSFLGLPLLGTFLSLLLSYRSNNAGPKVATSFVWLCCLGFLSLYFGKIDHSPFFVNQIFYFTDLSHLMIFFTLMISGVVLQFSLSYLKGDRLYNRYFITMSALTCSLLLTFIANHLIVLFLFWTLNNILLVFLMIHKSEWNAAKTGGILAGKAFILGSIFLAIGLFLLFWSTGHSLLSEIMVDGSIDSKIAVTIALIFILTSACIQSGIWPFHKWLISSLNSPTTVSAFMHAGLLSGGGLLLIRFAPLLSKQIYLPTGIFILGALSLLLGTFWKLIQSDSKRMLACSSMGHMGFMFFLCGLGLYPVAIAHILWHGMYKFLLFLKVGNTVEEKKMHFKTNHLDFRSILSILAGVIAGVYGFYLMGKSLPNLTDTSGYTYFFMVLIAAQVVLLFLYKKRSIFEIIYVTCFCFAIGLFIGGSLKFIIMLVPSLQLIPPNPLNFFHILFSFVIFCSWVLINTKEIFAWEKTTLWKFLYVKMMQSSQPHPQTITVEKSSYVY